MSMDNVWKKTVGNPLRVAITSAAGRMAPSLLYLLVQGEAFGHSQRLILHLMDVEKKLRTVQGLARELLHSGFPLLADVVVTSKMEAAMKDVDAVFILPYPRLTLTRSRKEKLEEKLALYKLHGEALNMYAKPTVLVLLVEHPSNLNALVCSRYAPKIPVANFAGLSRFATNLARSAIAAKAGGRADYVYNIIALGNIGNALYLDTRYATMRLVEDEEERSVSSVLKNDYWLRGTFNKMIQDFLMDNVENTRALSVSMAAAQQMREWWLGTKSERWTNMVICSKGEYDVPPGLFFSFPVFINNNKEHVVVKGLKFEQFDLSKIGAAVNELQEEWKMAKNLCETYWPLPVAESIKEEEEENIEDDEECVFKGLRIYPAEDCELKKKQMSESITRETNAKINIVPRSHSTELRMVAKTSSERLKEKTKGSVEEHQGEFSDSITEVQPIPEISLSLPKESPAVPNNSPRSSNASLPKIETPKKKSSIKT